MARKHHSHAAESQPPGDRDAIPGGAGSPAASGPGGPSEAPGAAGPGDTDALDRCIAEIRRDRGDTVPVAEIGAVVRSILGSLGARADDSRLFHEVEELARYIHAAKAEIVALNPADIRETFLPTATDELDAIVQSTEKATGAIMDATEAIEAVSADAPPEVADRLQDATTRIYEACSFQDLTGQRITKVVRMLGSIEERVDALVRAFDPDGHAVAAAAAAAPGADDVQRAGNHGRASVAAVGDSDDDAALLNGPQDEGEAMKQDDIDALLNGS